ncbi:MAG: HEAT repeat domain-containing protein [Bacteroidales bacterium]|nr:HEAT repeat domain-containing protein [Bacteroidales bacterium]
MKRNFLNNAGLLLLAIVFSFGLVFAFIELPTLLDAGLQNNLGFPQFDHGGGDANAFKTELFIQGLHLRWIGYGSLILILGLIVVSYLTRKTGLAVTGAVGLFIPVFGQFAFSMFFLAGLGFLRVGWLPFLEISFDILDLGKVIYVPYWILRWFLGLFHWDAHDFISWFFMAAGAFLFTWGVLLWFKTRYSGDKVASSWIYKISRHPQYLGWILWSYGFILFSPHERSMKMTWQVPSSLPWLLMTMIIIGICMMEEIRMMKITGGSYASYRESSLFFFPLPKWLNRILTWPGRMVTGGEFPGKRRQVLWIVLIYTGIFMALSLFWMDLGGSDRKAETPEESKQELSEVQAKLEEAQDKRREIYALIEQIPGYGEAGKDLHLGLSESPNPVIREFALMHLGSMKVREAEDIIVRSLYDSVKRVRSSAIVAAGEIKSALASDSLAGILTNPTQDNNFFLIYGALGTIGDPGALPVLLEGLNGGEHYNQIAALDAIVQIDPGIGLTQAIGELQDEHVDVRRNAVIVCIQSGNPRAIEPLKAVFSNEDFEVRFYAKQGVKRLKNKLPHHREFSNSEG